MSEENTLSMESPVPTENAQDVTDLTTEEKDSLLIGEDIERQHEKKLAGKYTTAQELEKAYTELEKKLGEKSEPVSEESESEIEPDEDEARFEEGYEPNLLDALWEEGTNNSLSKETFEELKNMDPVELAKMAMQQRSRMQGAPQSRDFSDQDVAAIQGLVGGEENYNNMLGWAQQNIPRQEIELFDSVMDQGNRLAAYFAVKAMALSYQDGVGKEGRMVTGKAPRSTGDVFKSQQEMVEAMSDDRYNDDPAYRDAIMEKLQRSDINF